MKDVFLSPILLIEFFQRHGQVYSFGFYINPSYKQKQSHTKCCVRVHIPVPAQTHAGLKVDSLNKYHSTGKGKNRKTENKIDIVVN